MENHCRADENPFTFLQMKESMKRKLEVIKKQNSLIDQKIKKMNALVKKVVYVPLTPNSVREWENLIEFGDKLEKQDTESTTPLSLSLAQKRRKEKNYLRILQLCIKAYSELNKGLASDLKTAERCVATRRIEGQKEFVMFGKAELENYKAKIQRHESKLVRFEVKYPWLEKCPVEMSKILEKMQKLSKLQEERDSLLNDLELYQEIGIRSQANEIDQLVHARQT